MNKITPALLFLFALAILFAINFSDASLFHWHHHTKAPAPKYTLTKPASLAPNLTISSTTNSTDTNVYWALTCSWSGNTNLLSLKLGFGTNLNSWVYSISVNPASNSISFILTNSPYLAVRTFWWMTASNSIGEQWNSSWLVTPPYPANMFTLSWANNIAGAKSIYSKTNLNQPSWALFASGIISNSYITNMLGYSQFFRLANTNNIKGVIISISTSNPANTNSFSQ